MITFNKDDKCKVNGTGDLFMLSEARPFINQECTVIKTTKGGLIMVYLNSNPKLVNSFPKRNLDEVEKG